MKIAMTGASGLVGSALIQSLAREHHEVVRLSRPSGPNGWTIPSKIDAMINLAGASIAERRWTQERKAVLRSSRIGTTRGLVQSMAKCDRKPRVLISASAIGYYGDRGDEILTESSGAGMGFLAGLAEEWEAEARKAEALGVRVVLARFGIILAKQGGALPKMMVPFKLGIGGKLGSGRQWLSWVTMDDVVAIVSRALVNSSIAGAINVVSPAPVTNAEFTTSLARVMHRPAIFSVPAFALRLAVGEMADEGLLSSARAVPEKLKQTGYIFAYSHLDDALRAILN